MESHRHELPEDHEWTARPGYSALVAGRGAVSLEIPSTWDVEITPASVKVRDRPHPDDDCLLEMSYRQFPRLEPEMVPLEDFLLQSVEGQGAGRVPGPVHRERRADLGLAWLEHTFQENGRPARSRTALAIGRGTQVLVTMAFWEDRLEDADAAWRTAIETLKVGRVIRDPLTGRAEEPELN